VSGWVDKLVMAVGVNPSDVSVVYTQINDTKLTQIPEKKNEKKLSLEAKAQQFTT
jgi:hypothetical protein